MVTRLSVKSTLYDGKEIRMRKLIASLCAALLAVCGMAATAFAAFPERPVTLVVPYAAGGGSDIVARALAYSTEKYLGQTIVVVNKAGGAGTIGTSYVTNAKPDGYTVLFGSNGNLVLQPLYGGLDYGRDSFTHICTVLRVPLVYAVNPKQPFKDLKDFVAYAKANPGKATMATSAAGGATHLPMEDFFAKAGIKVTVLPMNGGGPAVTATVGGHSMSCVSHPSEVSSQLAAGNLRLLGIAEPERIPTLPDVPTFKEQGFDVVDFVWRCIQGPKGMPADVQKKLEEAFLKGMNDPQYQETIKKLGDHPWPGDAKALEAYWNEYYDRAEKTIKSLGLYNKNVKKK